MTNRFYRLHHIASSPTWPVKCVEHSRLLTSRQACGRLVSFLSSHPAQAGCCVSPSPFWSKFGFRFCTEQHPLARPYTDDSAFLRSQKKFSWCMGESKSHTSLNSNFKWGAAGASTVGCFRSIEVLPMFLCVLRIALFSRRAQRWLKGRSMSLSMSRPSNWNILKQWCPLTSKDQEGFGRILRDHEGRIMCLQSLLHCRSSAPSSGIFWPSLLGRLMNHYLRQESHLQ